MTYVSAREFVECVGLEDLDRFGKACLAYIKELPADTLIGLYYH